MNANHGTLAITILILYLVLIAGGCVAIIIYNSSYPNSPAEVHRNEETASPSPPREERSIHHPHVQVGPKIDVGPSFNLMNGELEVGPSLDMGPRIEF